MKNIISNIGTAVFGLALALIGTSGSARAQVGGQIQNRVDSAYEVRAQLHSGPTRVQLPNDSYLVIQLEDALITSITHVTPDGKRNPLQKSTVNMGDCANGHSSCWSNKGGKFQTCVCLSAAPNPDPTAARGSTAPVDSATTTLSSGGRRPSTILIPAIIMCRDYAARIRN